MLTLDEFVELESKLSDNRQFVHIYDDAQGISYYEEMTDGQYADYIAGVRE